MLTSKLVIITNKGWGRMALIEWNEKYSVNIKEFDDHHRKLVMLINELHEAMMKGSGKDVLEKIIKELAEYTSFHFSAEEKYFQKFNFPTYRQHKKEHDNFVAKVGEFQNNYSTGKVLLTMDINSFLKDWLLNHILKSDKDYSSFLNGKGIK